MDSPKLKPCPACGGYPEIAGTIDGKEVWIACGNLRGCRMGGPTRSTVEEAGEAWNALPRCEDIEQINREADFLAEHLHRAGIPCPGDGEKFYPYGECAEKGWPCIACFREWARQQTREEKRDGQEQGK